MNFPSIRLFQLLGMRTLILIGLVFVALSLGLSAMFIRFEAFESLHAFSRAHEGWELDELILVFISVVIALSVAAFAVTVVLGKRLLAAAQAQLRAEQQAGHGRKLQSLGVLLGGLAHSMNNHLLPIMTIARMVREDVAVGSQTHTDVDKLIEAAESARTMLR